MIHFRCTRCFQVITAEDSLRGLGIDCQYCHKRLEVPSESEQDIEHGVPATPKPVIDDDIPLTLAEFDDEPEQEIVEEEPFNPNVKLVPIECMSCRTRFYASENQIGKYRRCPDCDRLNLVPELEPEYRIEVELSPNGGYYVHDPQVSGGLKFRLNVDYRNIPQVQQDRAIPDIYEPTLPISPQQPVTPSTPPEFSNTSPQQQPAQLHKTSPTLEHTIKAPPILSESAFVEKEPPLYPGALLKGFFTPFFNQKASFRLLGLLFLVFFGGLFAVQTVTWLVQGWSDTIPDNPAHVYTRSESLVFFLNYMVGTTAIVLGGIFVLIYSLMICINSYKAKDKSSRWGDFNTDFGINICVWLVFFAMVTSIPGIALGMTLELIAPETFHRGWMTLFQGISFYLFFPILFLAVLENDLFYDFLNPKKVYRSFGKLFKTWLLFYLVSGLIFVIGFVPLTVLAFLRLQFELGENFHFIVFFALAFALAFMVVPMLYFRLIGRMAWIIQKTIQLPKSKKKIR